MKQMMFVFIVACLSLSACSQQYDSGKESQMLRLQLLLTQSAHFAILPGEAARKHSAELARRAMSGPEMNAMHHGEDDHQTMMHATHDLGDAVFDLLEAATSQAAKHESLQSQIQMAVEGAQLRLTGQLLGNETGAFMQEKGNSIVATSMSHATGESAYEKAATHLLGLLHKTGAKEAAHQSHH